MAGSKSDAFEVEVLKLATGQTTSFSSMASAGPYLALFSGTLTGDTPGTEVSTSSTGYARVDTHGKWAAPTSGAGTVATNAAILFATATGSWAAGGAITHFGLFDASTGGNALYYGDLTDQTKTYTTGDAPNFPSGSITLTEG